MDQKQYEYNAGRVSIVTPVYNGETHLAKMLDSVLAQTYPDVEMILVDDGSADGTVRAAQNYSEKFEEKGYGYRIVRAEHKNASAAINRGLPFVSGEYLIWPDSDDYLEPESIRRRVDFLRQHPQYACVRSLSYYFDEETGTRSEKADEQRGDLKKLDLFWDILESKTFVCCGCYMLRTKAFFEVYPKRRIPEYDVGQNFQMLLPFMYRHQCPTIEEELYGVAVREGSHSRTVLTQAQEEKKYRDYEKLVDEIAENCGITDRESRERILCWKARRRYQIALKYGRKKAAANALVWLHRCGGFRVSEALKEIIWLYCVNSWVEEKIYPIYQKITSRK
ncbi:MAG: glycosyltransferase family 2 protein [Ruminococcus sp.]|jgi:glycosyltransferase involved in cell wall biosynthesis|nr:glycosyltransferase family A protein [uncultured Schaedlerella sp.]MCI8766514.1 glycosyltransferase family 2 protein [Ruminococcus sp.]